MISDRITIICVCVCVCVRVRVYVYECNYICMCMCMCKCVYMYMYIYMYQTLKADYLNAVYFRRGLMCTIGLTNDLIDGGQPRAKNGF